MKYLGLVAAGAALLGLLAWHHHAGQLFTHGHGHGHERPSNQTAVLTVWSPTDHVEATARFYEEVLGLERVSEDGMILDTDGTFLVVMQGTLVHPKDTARRWPLFALSVPDLDAAVKALEQAGVELPWGIEVFGTPEPDSRYVMFHDPAGNLIELVEWL